MIIKLTNFKCYANATFTFADNGLTLLNAESGTGKTTILKSIIYCFFGKIKKPCMFDKRSCKVIIDYLDHTITRTTTPNTLIVLDNCNNIAYESDAAQGIIFSLLKTTYQEFMISSCIIKKTGISLLSMTPSQQLKLINILAKVLKSDESNSGGNNDSLKNDTKLAIKKCNSDIDNVTTKIQMLTSSLEEHRSRYRMDDVDKPDRSLEDVSVEINDTNECIANLEANNDALLIQLTTYKKTLIEETHLVDLINKTKTELDMLNSSLLGYEQSPDESLLKVEEGIKSLEEELKSYTIKQDFLKEKGEYLALLKEFNDILDDKSKDVISEENIENLKSDIEKLKSDIKLYEKEITLYTSLTERKARAKKTVASLFSTIKKYMIGNVDESILQKIKLPSEMITFLEDMASTLYVEQKTLQLRLSIINLPSAECPCCKTKLILNDNHTLSIERSTSSLVGSKESIIGRLDEILSTTQTISSYIEKLKITLSDYTVKFGVEPIKPNYDNLQVLTSDLQLHVRRRAEYDTLKQSRGTTLDRMKARIESRYSSIISNDIDHIEHNHNITILQEQLENMKDTRTCLKNDIQQRDEYVSAIDEKHLRLEELETDLTAIRQSFGLISKGHGIDAPNIEGSITANSRKILDYTTNLNKLQSERSSIDMYNIHMKHMEDQTILEKDIIQYNGILKNLTYRLKGYAGFESTVKEAELLAVRETLRCINDKAAEYLEKMFSFPICVRLENIKSSSLTNNKTTGKKFAMNIYVEYKNKIATFDDLSDGEAQRCELAFLLAVNDMVGSRILLLDECLNHLHDEIATSIIGNIKDLCPNKLGIIVSHHAIKGIFVNVKTL